MALKPKRGAEQQGPSVGEPQTTTTPAGHTRVPGFYNPYNPYDTGRHGEQNKELNQGKGGKINGWDYDKGAPMPGAVLDENGMWVLGGGGGGGGGMGGDSSLLMSSPYYQQTLAAVNAAAAADAAARRGGVQQALIGFGEVPGTFADKYGDIDTLTRSLADKNTKSGISSKARLLQARSDAIREYSRRLSSKGLRRSGAKGYGLRRRQLEFDQSYSDALGKLLGYTGGLYSQFAGNEYQRQLSLAQALAYASQNLGDFGLGGGGGVGAPSARGGGQFVPYDPGRATGTSQFDYFDGGGSVGARTTPLYAPSGYEAQRPGRISGVQEY